MRKLLSILLALILASALPACGAEVPETVPESAAEPAAASPTLAPEEPEPTVVPTSEPQKEEKELPPPPDIDINSWEFLYAGPNNGLSRYLPQSIREVEGQHMDRRVSYAAQDFLNAAREAGNTVYMAFGYSIFEYSMYWFEAAMREYGSAYEAAKHVFAPGCSDHSTGLSFDITDEPFYASNYYNMHDETVLDTPAYQWMAEHCAEYGFIVRYPEGKEEYYGMACYPGHFRYVGVEAATYIMENDLCLEEFLALYK